MSGAGARKRVVIVGGVAGGASAAARLRRLDDAADITMFERGPDVSFANCGLPYHVGGVIPEERSLLLANPELFRTRFRIDVRTHTEVTRIDRERRIVETRDVRTGETAEWPWDALVLAPGAKPIRPPLPGLELPGVFVVRSIPDTRAIRSWIERPDRSDRGGAQKAVVIGGGFIGLEMAENLTHRGLAVTILEKAPQVMPPLDRDVAMRVGEHLTTNGVTLRLSEGVSGIERSADDRLSVRTDAGGALEADLVILAIGVRPETTLAREAGITLGAFGGIVVDASMRTSAPGIWAVGDVVENHDVVLDRPVLMPLAGPGNRQGRIAAASIAGREGRASNFRGIQGTAIVGVFGMMVATTGASEKSLVRAGRTDFDVVHLHPGSHAGYYPGAKPIHLKLIFETPSGRILGAQAVGADGVDKRIDVIAMALQMGATVFDLAEAELCYAPQFGAAKDPVNVAGMIAVNVLNGDAPQARWSELEGANPERVTILDVRQPEEFARGHIPGAVLMPLPTLREAFETLDRSRDILVYCAGGQRAYFAQRFLMQHGFNARNLPGGWLTYIANR